MSAGEIVGIFAAASSGVIAGLFIAGARLRWPFACRACYHSGFGHYPACPFKIEADTHAAYVKTEQERHQDEWMRIRRSLK